MIQPLLCVGMGVPTVTAARILKGQMSGQNGEETQLEMDKFPYVALSKVHPTCCNPIIPFLCVHKPCSRSPGPQRTDSNHSLISLAGTVLG